MTAQLSPAQENLRDRFDAIDAAYATQLQTSNNPDQLASAKIKAYAAEYAKFRTALAQLEKAR